MPQHHQLTIVLGKHLSGQVDRALEIWKNSQVDVSALLKAVEDEKAVTAALKKKIDENQPNT